nr:hypothetical protein [Tanacetum cinerariifolium]
MEVGVVMVFGGGGSEAVMARTTDEGGCRGGEEVEVAFVAMAAMTMKVRMALVDLWWCGGDGGRRRLARVWPEVAGAAPENNMESVC